MNLDELRIEIDDIDRQMVELFARRMEVCRNVAEYKRSVGKNVFDPERERKKLVSVAELAGENMRSYAVPLYSLMMDLSKAYQEKVIARENELVLKINEAISSTAPVFPEFATVACQGVEGAYSQIA